MLVRQMDNAGRFSVTSADDRDYYVVDITENEGRMVCSCADFRFRCQRQLDTGSKAYPYSSSSLRTGCKHTHAVVLFLGQTYIAAISGKKQNRHIRRQPIMTWHTLEHSIFSQEPGEESLQTFCLDTYLSELAKSSPIQETSCSPGSETDSCQSSPYGTTYAPLTESLGEDQLTFFAEASHVRTSVRQVKEQELQGSVRDFGRNMRDSLERCGLDLSLPKTHLCFAPGDLELSSKTWPRWGIMLDGECSELGMSVRHINETECGSWPTPDVRGFTNDGSLQKLSKSGVSRTEYSQMAYRASKSKKEKIWPTPCTRDYKGINAPEGLTRKDGKSRMDQLPNAVAYGGTQIQQTYPTPTCMMGAMFAESNWEKRNSPSLASHVKYISPTTTEQKKNSAQLNPSWVEWLMGWPIGWTGLKPLETDKFHSVQLWHSLFSQKD
jgi:hypothetical protein